ncbi:hypothetical protein HAX54_010496 [Datura stramonium]|uniref:Uncharacterized protein n=1 Tax=Datura stramonium TaxID=4076 RepID=A0ABS8WVY7_DATST|nr:hypothetical protein [Datura stramonium]
MGLMKFHSPASTHWSEVIGATGERKRFAVVWWSLNWLLVVALKLSVEGENEEEAKKRRGCGDSTLVWLEESAAVINRFIGQTWWMQWSPVRRESDEAATMRENEFFFKFCGVGRSKRE